MTEDEAKTKWCPMIRFAGAGNPVNGGVWSTNRGDDPGDIGATKCLASGCMMWRWTFIDEALTDSKTHGYCGLAGKP